MARDLPSASSVAIMLYFASAYLMREYALSFSHYAAFVFSKFPHDVSININFMISCYQLFHKGLMVKT